MQNTPIVLDDREFEMRFDAEKVKYLQSIAWKKLLEDFLRNLKQHVASADTEAMIIYLRKQRIECLENFKRKNSCSYVWEKCFDINSSTFNTGMFMRKMLALNDGYIEQKELDDLMEYLCMTENIEKILTHAIKLQNNKTQGNAIQVFVNQLNYNNGSIIVGMPHSQEDVEEEHEEEILRNIIFSERLFNTNSRLAKLRDTIGASLDMPSYNVVFGYPERPRINVANQYEWYYIFKAINEAGIARNKFSVKNFIEQVLDWFPYAFNDFETLDERKAFIRKMEKSISHERGLWKFGTKKEETPIKDMWAKWKSLHTVDYAKVSRMQPVAIKLWQALLSLKSEIQQENSL